MSVMSTFSQLAALNGGSHEKFSQAKGLKQVNAGSKGVCQAYCVYDSLSAMSGEGAKQTKRKNAIEWSNSYQSDFVTADLEKWDVGSLRNKYLGLLAKLDLSNVLRVAYVDNCANLDELMGFLVGKRGYFHLLSPLHVTGVYIPSGAQGRYFDPNCGIAGFVNMDSLLAFISDYHSSKPFKDAYGMAVGDLFVVHVNAT
jgi:hypothetical protein